MQKWTINTNYPWINIKIYSDTLRTESEVYDINNYREKQINYIINLKSGIRPGKQNSQFIVTARMDFQIF